jgi:hypothetical protein
MHPFRKISLFRAFCAGLKYGALPSRAPFKSYPDCERTRSFACGVRCGAAILSCAGVCYNFVQESRQIPTTRTPLLPAATELRYGDADVGIPEDSDDDESDDRCDDPNCGCHDDEGLDEEEAK